MKFEITKKINKSQLFKECKDAGINLISITSDKQDNLILESDKDLKSVLTAHIPKVELTRNEKIDNIQNLNDVKEFLKG